MANKTQAKAAIDAAVILVKADIDNILPIGVNITDGAISFGPTRWQWILNAENSSTTAENLTTAIVTNLTAAGRTSKINRQGRRAEDLASTIIISTVQAVYTINNFKYNP